MKTFITEEHQGGVVKAIQGLVAFPSVLNEGEDGPPFGQAVFDALKHTLAVTENMGFQTYLDPKGYYGYAEIGEGEETLAVLCHLDVVPAGDLEKWETPPFEATIKEGQLYGRGVQDDKGPSMLALYAVKALMDAGVTFNKKIRFIFGTDEETLWRCMNRYNELESPATMGFAPDSAFPVTYAEKGLLQAKLIGPSAADLRLEADQAFNVVPGKATYTGDWLEGLITELDSVGFDYERTGDSVTVLGVSRHSKDATKGINAIVRLAKALRKYSDHPALQFIADAVGEDATGSGLLGDVSDAPSGQLSFNIAGLTVTEERSEIRLDLRIPVLADKEALVRNLSDKAAEYQLNYEEFDYLAPLYVPLDSELVSTLMAVYQDKTGDMIPAQTSGGASFARTMPNCVAFGARFPEVPSTEHQENERVPLEALYRAMDIYAEAIYRLAGKE